MRSKSVNREEKYKKNHSPPSIPSGIYKYGYRQSNIGGFHMINLKNPNTD